MRDEFLGKGVEVGMYIEDWGFSPSATSDKSTLGTMFPLSCNCQLL